MSWFSVPKKVACGARGIFLYPLAGYRKALRDGLANCGSRFFSQDVMAVKKST